MTISIIQTAMAIQKTVKDVPSINAVLTEASEVLMERSPFFTTTNLVAMAKKGKTNDELQWITEMIFDLCIIVPQTWIQRLRPKNAVGVLDVMLFKRELKLQLLDQSLEDIELPADEKAKFKKCLNSPSEMRDRLFSSGSKAVHNPDKKAMFFTGTTTAGEKYFLECFKVIYTTDMDDVIEGHISGKNIARDVVTKLPALVEKIEDMKKEADAANAEDVAEAAEYEEDSDHMDDDLQASKVPMGSKGPLTPSKDTDRDEGQFLGYAWDGTEVRSKGLPVDTMRQTKAIYQECVHTVNRECTFIFFDDQYGEDTIADAIRDSQAIGSCPDRRTGIFYEVGTSGVAACNPARNPPPSRKDNFDKVFEGIPPLPLPRQWCKGPDHQQQGRLLLLRLQKRRQPCQDAVSLQQQQGQDDNGITIKTTTQCFSSILCRPTRQTETRASLRRRQFRRVAEHTGDLQRATWHWN